MPAALAVDLYPAPWNGSPRPSVSKCAVRRSARSFTCIWI